MGELVPEYPRWIREQQRVRAIDGGGHVVGEGVAISWTDRPTLGIRKDDGTVFDWHGDMCEPVERSGPETIKQAGVKAAETDTAAIRRAITAETERQIAIANVTRLTINIGPTTSESLNHISAQEHITITEALRRLISYGNLIYRAVRDGKDVLLIKDGMTQQVLIPEAD